MWEAGSACKRTSLDVPADVSRLSEVCGPSDDDEQGVFVGAEVEVRGRGAPRLLPDLPLRHPAGRHVGEPAVGMWCHWVNSPADGGFYYRQITDRGPVWGNALVH